MSDGALVKLEQKLIILEEKVIKLHRKFKKCLVTYCPTLFDIFYLESKEHSKKKIIFGALYGLVLGILFYERFLVRMKFNAHIALLLGGIICIILVVGNALSTQMRCIVLLTLPVFCGGSGRAFLKALLLVYIIMGPFHNLMDNGREVVRVFSCSSILTYNLTKTRFDLVFKPFSEALLGIKTDTNEVKDTLRSINDVSAPIVKEIEDESEMSKMKEENDYLDEKLKEDKRSKEIYEKYKIQDKDKLASMYEKKYFSKIETRCEDQLSRGAAKCKAQFENVYDKCYDTVSAIAAWLLCWPMKLTFVCNVVQAIGSNKICDPTKSLEHGIGEGYVYLLNTKASLAQNLKNVKLQYQIEQYKPPINVHQGMDTALAVYHDFQEKRSVVDLIFTTISNMLAFLFLQVIFSAQEYHDNYLKHLDYDNVYMTRYFRKIDARRHYRGQRTLFPLKKIETKRVIPSLTLRLLKTEQSGIIYNSFRLIIEMVIATSIVLIDRLFYEVLDIIARHSRITMTQKGKHDMMVQVRGTGLLAGILKSVITGFNVKKRIKTIQTNEACLPRPSLLPTIFLYKIYGIFVLLWILLVVNAYTLRLRHAICAYFYPKREKQRILFLYNEMLKRRRRFFKEMRQRAMTKSREERLEEEYNFIKLLIIYYPKYFSWLKFLEAARRKCVICEEVEPLKKKLTHNFESCRNIHCNVVYCWECWLDVNKQCLVCTPYNEAETSGPDLTDSDHEQNDG